MRRVASEEFFSTLRDMVRKHRSHIFVLAETKTNSGKAINILHNSHYDLLVVS